MAEFESWAPWLSRPKKTEKPLEGDITADTVIVGGGFVGLNCAIELREAGLDVVIVEKEFCGAGSSGRNAGHLTPTAGKDFPTLVQYFGKERAVTFAQFAERAVIHTESVIKKHGIECHYRPSGNIIAGVHPRQRKPLEEMYRLSNSLGVNVQFLDEAEVRKRALPPFVLFGVQESHGGLLNPGEYVQSLRKIALEKGVRIFENTTAESWRQQGNRMQVQTPKGSVTGDKVVVATNAYTTATLKKKKSRIFPLRVTLFQTPVLTPKQREALGWPGEEGIYTAHEALENYRLTADGRLSGGSKIVNYAFGSKLASGNRADVFAKWKALFSQRFSHVPDLEIETFWGGWIGMTLDYIPLLDIEMKGRLIYGIGFNGHGIAQGTKFGSLLADIVLGKENPDQALFKRRLFPLPPEPLRWLGIQGLMRFYNGIDRRVDAQIAATDKTG